MILKERRPLVIAVCETPLHANHLRNMLTLSEMGTTIAPLMPAFYHQPTGVDELVDQTVLRLLDQVGVSLEFEYDPRWRE